MAGTEWYSEANRLVDRIASGDEGVKRYRTADAEMVRLAMEGRGPESGHGNAPASGMRVVYNISSAHLPSVMSGETDGDPKPYKNRYDLAASKAPVSVTGDSPLAKEKTLRESIDEVIAGLLNQKGVDGKDFYYGAVELNGAGIRYFGDMCVVLNSEATDRNTVVLYRNSYDLSRSPLREEIFREPENNFKRALAKAEEFKGYWPNDVPDMAACKVLDGASSSQRRITTGTVSAGVLLDEDYIEVVRLKSFGASQIEEIRISAADAGAEGRIGDRIAHGPPPSLAELQWRHRRRAAEKAASMVRVPARVITTGGRVR